MKGMNLKEDIGCKELDILDSTLNLSGSRTQSTRGFPTMLAVCGEVKTPRKRVQQVKFPLHYLGVVLFIE